MVVKEAVADISNVLSNIKKGDIENALIGAQKLLSSGDGASGLRVLRELAVAVHKLKDELEPSMDIAIIYELALTCCLCISKMSEKLEGITNFGPALYHVMHYIGKGDQVQWMLDLKSFIQIEHIEEKLKDTLFSNIHLLLGKKAEVMLRSQDEKSQALIVNTFKESLECLSLSDFNLLPRFCSIFMKCVAKFEKENYNKDLVNGFYSSCLEFLQSMLGRCGQAVSYDVFKNILLLLAAALSYCVRSRTVKVFASVLSATSAVRLLFRANVVYEKCMTVFESKCLIVKQYIWEPPNNLGYELQSFHENVLDLFDQHFMSKNKDVAMTLISLLAGVIQDMVACVNKDDFQELTQRIISEDSYTNLPDVLFTYARLLKGISSYPNAVPNDKIHSTNGAPPSLMVWNVILQLIKYALDCGKDCDKNFLLSANQKAVSEILGYLKEIRTKDKAALISGWNSYGYKFWHMSFQYHKMTLPEAADPLMHLHCRYFCMVLSPENVKDFWKSVDGYSKILQEMGKLKDALMYLTIALIISPDCQKEIFRRWCNIKNCAKLCNRNEIQNCTVYDILTEDCSQLEDIYPALDLSVTDAIILLKYEIRAYAAESVEMYDAILAAGNVLQYEAVKVVDRVEGMVNIVSVLWDKEENIADMGAIKLCKKIISLLKDEEKAKSKTNNQQQLMCYLGMAYYWLFFSELQLEKKKLKEEIEQSAVIPLTAEDNEGEEQNPEDACDVTPAYRDLVTSQEAKILDILNTAVNYWEKAVEKEINSDVLEEIDITSVLKCIYTAAQTFAMYACDVQKIKTWIVYYKFGLMLSNVEVSFKALIQLLKCAKLEPEAHWVAKSEEIAARFKDADQILLLNYWLSKSWHCLLSDQLDEGCSLLHKVLESLPKKFPNSSLLLLHVEAQYLLGRYLTLPKKFVSALEDEDRYGSLEAGANAFSKLHYFFNIRNNSWCNQDTYMQGLSLLFDVTSWLARQYFLLDSPREARCYAKEQLLLSQKLALSNRTAQFLSILADVDILCHNVDDCQVKLLGLAKVLECDEKEAAKELVQKSELMAKLKTTEVNDDPDKFLMPSACIVKELVNDWTEQVREVPNRKKLASTAELRGSPSLEHPLFKMPNFIFHPRKCSCYRCINVVHQNEVLRSILIQAQLSSLRGDNTKAVSFFKGALTVYNHLMLKRKHILASISHAWDLEFGAQTKKVEISRSCLEIPLEITNAKVLLAYGEYLGFRGRFTDAQFYNLEALSILSNLWEAQIHLFHSALEKQLSLHFAIKEEEESTKALCDAPMLSSASTDNCEAASITPVRKVCITPHSQMKPLRILQSSTKMADFDYDEIKPAGRLKVRPLVFDSDDDGDSNDVQNSVESSKEKTKEEPAEKTSKGDIVRQKKQQRSTAGKSKVVPEIFIDPPEETGARNKSKNPLRPLHTPSKSVGNVLSNDLPSYGSKSSDIDPYDSVFISPSTEKRAKNKPKGRPCKAKTKSANENTLKDGNATRTAAVSKSAQKLDRKLFKSETSSLSSLASLLEQDEVKENVKPRRTRRNLQRL